MSTSPGTTAALLLNAGAARARRLADEASGRFSACGMQVETSVVQQGDDLEAAVRTALLSQPDLFIAGGGDGTVSTVASVLAGKGIPLGVLPLGTLNHFAQDLGIPLKLEAAIDTLCRGRVATVDVARVNGRLFINNASIGFYPQLVQERDELRRLGHTKWRAVLRAFAQVFRRFPLIELRIEVDGETRVHRTPLLFIGNNRYELTPGGFGARRRLDGGSLSLYLIRRTDRLGLIRLALLAAVGALPGSRDFESVSARHVRVDARSRYLKLATDGELRHLATPLIFDLEPQALPVIVPDTQGRA